MINLILGVFEITIGMSLFIVLLLLGLKLFGGKFTAKCRYIIWALIMLRLAIPFSFGLLPTLIEIPIETELVQTEDISNALSENTNSITTSQPSDPGNIVVNPTVPSVPNVNPVNPGDTPTLPADQTESVIPSEPSTETPAEQPISLKQILDITGIVYLTGAAIFLVWRLVSYVIYTRKILRSAKAVDDRTRQIFSTICKKYGIKKQPTLLVASEIHSPAAFGIFRRRIVLPDIVFTDNGLVGTLAHEVTHCKRGDLYMKLVELIACSLNWFNPLVHIAAFQCEMEMELSCDEKVLSGSNKAARAAYANVMLDIIHRCRRNRGALTTHFNPKKSAVTARFKNILYGSGNRRGRILIGVCLVLCVLASTFVACQTGDKVKENSIVEEQLLSSIALPMGQDVLEVADYDILLCGDDCDPTAVVSRASQGYAPAYRIVPDGEIDGNFKVLKFKMEIPEPMLEDVKEQGVYEQIVEEIESQYFYLLVLDEKHYAYIHLERVEGAEKTASEAEQLADSIVKNARISFEPDNKKFDLNIERVIRLAENKGEELTWDDFKIYNTIETGSGLYILVYEIDETFDLMIGGVPTSSPMYIRLVTKADRDNYIDIRTEDVEKFVSENRKEAFETEHPATIYSELVEVDSIPKGLESAVNTGNTADGLSHFYLFQYGLEYYRYDSETDTYYKGILTLPNGYNYGKIHTFRQTSSDRGIEIIIRAVDESGDNVYLGYKFTAAIDPLNSQPSSRAVYDDEEDFIGVTAEFETEIVWDNIDGEWYYSFRDDEGYKFYRLAFNSKTAKMNFDYGFYESEYVNRYTGSYTVDATSKEITAVLHDSSIVHTDPDITLKFRLDSSENSNGGVLVWKVVSCDVDKYRHLIGTNVEFTKNMQSILELSAATDWKNVDGEWYYSFRDDEGYQFYGLAFNSNTGTMKFDYGFYESEYVNRYTGTYTVDSDSQEITAVLHDSSVMHFDPDITLKFTLEVQSDQNNKTLVLYILNCDVPKYQRLVGQSIEFTREFGYAELEYRAVQGYYQMWYDKELAVDVLLDKYEVKKDVEKKVREATGIELLTTDFIWEYAAEEDRFPLRFFVTDDAGTKMIETNIIRYKDETDGNEKFSVEVNPTVITVE